MKKRQQNEIDWTKKEKRENNVIISGVLCQERENNVIISGVLYQERENTKEKVKTILKVYL